MMLSMVVASAFGARIVLRSGYRLITGVGMVTPVGNDVATTWDALLAGRSGGAPITPAT